MMCQISPTATEKGPRRTAASAARVLSFVLLLALLVGAAPRLAAQKKKNPSANEHPSAPVKVETTHPEAEPETNDATVKLTLTEALKRARALSPTLLHAVTNAKVAAEQPTQSRGINLPTVSSNSQYLYTQGNGTPAARYIANNGVHEYIAQVDVHQSLSLPSFLEYRKSVVAAALSKDQTEIARRGLMVAVVQAYAELVADDHKVASQRQAMRAAQNFMKTTQQLAHGGEIAYADVVKARLEYEDSQVTLEDTKLADATARAALAMMVFRDVDEKYEVVDEPGQTLKLPAFDEVQSEARHENPSLDAALKGERMAQQAVDAARAEYLPTMTLDYFYGIDANHFATQSPSGPGLDPELHGMPIQNLGYSALASITLPIWNWGATRSKIKSAEVLRHEAVLDREFAERKLVVQLREFYGEAKMAKAELAIRKSAVADAEESRKLTLLRYKAGDASALEVVSAEQALTQEQNAYEDAETRYATALANLATLTGTL